MRCPKPPYNCYFCYNGVCYAEHWWQCAEGFRKPHEGNKNNRYCKKGE